MSIWGGSFLTYRGGTAKNLAKVNATSGALDTTFTGATGINATVNALALAGSSVYVGGAFTTYRGAAAQNLAKLDTTSGVLDTTFTAASGTNNSISALAVAGSSLYFAGQFTSYRGVAVQRLAKVDLTSGVLDSVFTQTLGMDAAATTLAVLGSTLYVGGNFSSYGGVPAQNLVKMDAVSGVVDTTFSLPTGPNGTVQALALSGSSLYLGGGFTTYRGVAAPYLAKIDGTSGVLDTTFTPPVGLNTGGVRTIGISGTSLYAGGYFTSYRGVTVEGLIKVDSTSGVLDTTFTQTTGAYGTDALIVAGTSVYIAGFFSNYRGAPANSLAKIDATSGALDTTSGALDTTFTQATGLNNEGYALALNAGSLYVGGLFGTYRGGTANRLAKIDATSGVLDTTFTQAVGTDNYVSSLLFSGSSLYLGGRFLNYRGVTAQRLAKVDGTSGNLDTGFTQSTGITGPAATGVEGLWSFGNTLYAGGGFAAYRSSRAYYVFPIDINTGASLDP